MFKKYSWLITLLAVLTMVLAACPAPAAPAGDSGGGDAATGTDPGDEGSTTGEGSEGEGMSYEDVDPSGETITFWHQHTRDREESLNAIVADFNENNEHGITINAEYQGGYGDIFNKMLSVAGTADVPNLVVAYQNQAATYQLADTLVDMRALVDSEAWGLSEEEQADFFPGFFSADLFPSFDDARLGFPPNRSMEMMYYNALSVDASRFASWTFAFGGDVFDYDTGQYSYDNDAAVEAMTFLQELFANGCAAEVAEQYGDQTDFGNGSLLFTVGSSSGMPFYKSAVDEGAGFEWSVAPLPRTTEDPVTSAEVQADWARASNYFPVRQSVADGMGEYFEENAAYQTAFDLLEYGQAEPPMPGYDFVRDIVSEVMAAVATGGDVAESLADLSEEANEILAEQME